MQFFKRKRQLFAVGHVTPSKHYARFCPEGNHWFSGQDIEAHERGEPTVYTLCPLHAVMLREGFDDEYHTPPRA